MFRKSLKEANCVDLDSLRLSLVSYGFHGFGHFFRITQVLAVQGFQVFIQFINQRHTRGYAHANDLLFGNAIEVFDQSPQRIAMSCNEDILTRVDLR